MLSAIYSIEIERDKKKREMEISHCVYADRD